MRVHVLTCRHSGGTRRLLTLADRLEASVLASHDPDAASHLARSLDLAQQS